MVGTANEEVIPRTMADASRHAIRHHEAVDNDRSAGDTAASGIRQLGVDHIDAPNVDVANRVFIRQQKKAGVWVPHHPSQTSRSDGASTSADRGNLTAEFGTISTEGSTESAFSMMQSIPEPETRVTDCVDRMAVEVLFEGSTWTPQLTDVDNMQGSLEQGGIRRPSQLWRPWAAVTGSSKAPRRRPAGPRPAENDWLATPTANFS